MSTATSALTVACAKPDCHWKGPPADAPTHPCPTPDADAPRITTNIEDAALAEKATVQVAIAERGAALIAEREALFAKLDAAKVTYDKGTSIAGLRELVALTTGEVAEPDAPAYDSDPTTRDELEAWLGAHGSYDSRGVPGDEKTATLDARYAVFLDDERVEAELAEADLDAEPELETEPVAPGGSAAASVLAMDDVPADLKAAAADALVAEDHAAAVDAAWDETPRPWQTVIAAALDEQTGVKDYRWLVVWHPADATRESELIGRGKVKHEAVVVQEDVIARGQLTGEIVVVKTADVLQTAEKIKADAARADAVTEWDDARLAGVAASDHTLAVAAQVEIERRRELVQPEPDRVIEEAPEDGKTPPAQEETPGEQTEALAAPKTPPPGAKPALFDASDYERADLALPQVDGHNVDRIAVHFSGEVMLDRSNPDHVGLFRRLKLGRKVELWVEAKGLGVAGKGATNKDGELDVVVSKRSVVIQTVRILGPEDLGNAATEIASQARDALEQQADREAAAAADADA